MSVVEKAEALQRAGDLVAKSPADETEITLRKGFSALGAFVQRVFLTMEPIIAAEGDGETVHLVYSRGSVPANDHGGEVGEWNREHLWPRSLGIGRSGPDSTDLHALMPCAVSANSSRGNLPFDDADAGGPARGAPECLKGW